MAWDKTVQEWATNQTAERLVVSAAAHALGLVVS